MASSICIRYSHPIVQHVDDSIHIKFTDNFICNPLKCNFEKVRLFVANDF